MQQMRQGGRVLEVGIVRLKSAALLRALMEQQGVSTRALAAAAGVHHSFIDHLLSGRRDTCQAAVVARIARKLSAPRDLLFEAETVRLA